MRMGSQPCRPSSLGGMPSVRLTYMPRYSPASAQSPCTSKFTHACMLLGAFGRMQNPWLLRVVRHVSLPGIQVACLYQVSEGKAIDAMIAPPVAGTTDVIRVASKPG